MASSLVFSPSVFSSKESPSAGHMSCQTLREGSNLRSTNVRFRGRFNARATQTSGAAEAISGPGHTEGQSLYEVLGLSRCSTAKDIKRAYRKLARKFHPDHATSPQEKEQNTQMFVRIQSAYLTLSDPHNRAQYDRQLVGQVPGFARQRWSQAAAPGYRDWSGRVGRNWETDQCW